MANQRLAGQTSKVSLSRPTAGGIVTVEGRVVEGGGAGRGSGDRAQGGSDVGSGQGVGQGCLSVWQRGFGPDSDPQDRSGIYRKKLGRRNTRALLSCTSR